MKESARIRLSAYRPSQEDAADPAMAEALSETQRDPELASWFERSQQFDRQIAEQLSQIPVPAHLREQILAGLEASGAARPRRMGWLNWAALWIIFASGILWWNWPVALEPWQTETIRVLDQIETHSVKFDHVSPQSEQLRDWLRNHGGASPTELPRPLRELPTFGCKHFQSNGRTISLMCFDIGQDQAVHLATTSSVEAVEPRFTRRGEWSILHWSNANQSFMLIGLNGEPELRRFFALHSVTPAPVAILFP